jgi:hypothetical protein
MLAGDIWCQNTVWYRQWLVNEFVKQVQLPVRAELTGWHTYSSIEKPSADGKQPGNTRSMLRIAP